MMWMNVLNLWQISFTTAQKSRNKLNFKYLNHTTFLHLRAYNGSVDSPSSVITKQTGNSLEMSILLVSLLR